MQALYAAVTRAHARRQEALGLGSRAEDHARRGVAAYTAGSAYAEFQEHEKGRLVPGQLADLVILAEDVLAVPAERIKDVKVETTIVGGRVVYRRSP